jgi:hypothetical protein
MVAETTSFDGSGGRPPEFVDGGEGAARVQHGRLVEHDDVVLLLVRLR